jgi:hypothetical protein
VTLKSFASGTNTLIFDARERFPMATRFTARRRRDAKRDRRSFAE